MLEPAHKQHLDNLRTALARGMTDYLVEGLAMAALIGGCAREQVAQTAIVVGLPAGKQSVRRAIEEWARREAARRSAGTEPAPQGSARYRTP